MTNKIINMGQNPLKSAIARIQTIFSTVLFFLLVPIIFLLFLLPIYIYRHLIFKLAPIIRPDLGKILSSRSAVFAVDDIYHRPFSTMVATCVTELSVDVARARELVLQNWINFKCSDGIVKFPELTQYVTHWMGFPFWKNEDKFSLNQHVKLMKGDGKSIVSRLELTQLVNEIVMKPFQNKTSPWELTIVPIFRDTDGVTKSATILRMHHCQSDGFGGLTLISNLCKPLANSQETVVEVREDIRSQRRSGVGLLCEKLYLTFRSPYDAIKLNWEKADPIKSNTWHVPEDELEKKWTLSYSEELISVQLVKDIKNNYRVSFNAVVMAGIAGAVRNFMLKNPSKKVPGSIHAGLPVPMRPHPGKMRNFWAIAAVELPVGKKSSRNRLLFMESQLQKLKSSPSSFSSLFLATPALGSLFPVLIRPSVTITNVGVVASNLPGPSDPCNFLDRKLLYTEFTVGLGSGHIGIMMTTMSSSGGIRVGASVDNGLISNIEDVKFLANGVKKELLILKNGFKEQV